MKSLLEKAFAALVVLTTALVLNAQTPPAQTVPPASLASTMKRMSSDLKKVAAQVNNSAMNAESEALSNDYVAMALHSKNFTPDKIAALPAGQQKGPKADYDLTLDKTAENGLLLAKAFHDNDNAKAIEILNLLSQDKKDGHAKFK
jgi:hypothetical protein